MPNCYDDHGLHDVPGFFLLQGGLSVHHQQHMHLYARFESLLGTCVFSLNEQKRHPLQHLRGFFFLPKVLKVPCFGISNSHLNNANWWAPGTGLKIEEFRSGLQCKQGDISFLTAFPMEDPWPLQ